MPTMQGSAVGSDGVGVGGGVGGGGVGQIGERPQSTFCVGTAGVGVDVGNSVGVAMGSVGVGSGSVGVGSGSVGVGMGSVDVGMGSVGVGSGSVGSGSVGVGIGSVGMGMATGAPPGAPPEYAEAAKLSRATPDTAKTPPATNAPRRQRTSRGALNRLMRRSYGPRGGQSAHKIVTAC